MSAGRLLGQVYYASIIAAASGATLVAGVSGKKIRVLSLVLTSSQAMNVQFNSGGGTSPAGDVSGHLYLAQNGSLVLPFNEMGWFQTLNNGDALELNMSASNPVGGSLSYVLVPP